MGSLSLDSPRRRVTSVLVTGPPENHIDVGLRFCHSSWSWSTWAHLRRANSTLLYSSCVSLLGLCSYASFALSSWFSWILYGCKYPCYLPIICFIAFIATSIRIICLMTCSYLLPRHRISCLMFLAVLIIVSFVSYILSLIYFVSYQTVVYPIQHLTFCSLSFITFSLIIWLSWYIHFHVHFPS